MARRWSNFGSSFERWTLMVTARFRWTNSSVALRSIRCSALQSFHWISSSTTVLYGRSSQVTPALIVCVTIAARRLFEMTGVVRCTRVGRLDEDGDVVPDEAFPARKSLSEVINDRARELYASIRPMVTLRHGISSDARPI